MANVRGDRTCRTARQCPRVIGARVARLGDAAGDVLSLAAVIGREFELDVLSGASGRTEDDLLGILDAAAAAAVVSEVPEHSMRFSFVHALIQHTLDQDLGASRRARAHRRIAEAMEAMTGAETRPRARSPATGSPARRVIGSGVFPTPSARVRTHSRPLPLRMPPTGSSARHRRSGTGTCQGPVSRTRSGRSGHPVGSAGTSKGGCQIRLDLARGGADPAAAVRAALLFAGEPELNVLETSLVPSCSKRPSQTSRDQQRAALVMARRVGGVLHRP